MVVYLGKTRYNLDTTDPREAISIIKEFCEERGYHHTAPIIIDSKTQHVTITSKSGQYVLKSVIYNDKGRNKSGNTQFTK